MRNRNNLESANAPADYERMQDRALREIRDNNNAYVIEKLRLYIFNRMIQINKIADRLELTGEQLQKVHATFYADIAKLRLMAAYTQNELYHPQSSRDVVDQRLFDHYMAINLKQYTDQHLENKIKGVAGYVDKRQDIIAHVNKIREHINTYQRTNKRSLVNTFSKEVDKIVTEFLTHPFDTGVNYIKSAMSALLDNLQKGENQHYNRMTFFVERRRSNSTLQPKIHAANQLMVGLNQLCEQSLSSTRLYRRHS